MSKLFILDQGHGKDTLGKSYKDLEEWKFNRFVLKYLTFELGYKEIPYHVLVPEDYDVSLRTRVNRANKLAEENECFLLSIHGNAFYEEGFEKVDGIETWYYSEVGKEYARIFQEDLIEELEWKDRGLKQGNFTIIKETIMPAVLVELGFYTNDVEREKMLDAEYQYKMGVSLAKSIETINNKNN